MLLKDRPAEASDRQTPGLEMTPAKAKQSHAVYQNMPDRCEAVAQWTVQDKHALLRQHEYDGVSWTHLAAQSSVVPGTLMRWSLDSN